jgi:hypothetical protein
VTFIYFRISYDNPCSPLPFSLLPAPRSPLQAHVLATSHVNRVYIGLCDWGMASHIVEDVPSVVGYSIMAEMERNKREHYWVALELFYVYGPSNSETSLEHVVTTLQVVQQNKYKHSYNKGHNHSKNTLFNIY